MALFNQSTVNYNFGAKQAWEILQPVNNDYLTIANAIGKKVSQEIQGNNIHFPMGASRDANDSSKIWISNFYGRIVRVNEIYTIDLVPNIIYQTPSTSNTGIRGVFNPISTSNYLICPSWDRHCVRIYDSNNNFELVSTIGIPNAAGHHGQGRLRNPMTALLLPNGNILVSCYFSGPNSSKSTEGTISEWNISTSTASLVRTQLSTASGNNTAVGTDIIRRPTQMFVDLNDASKVWAVEFLTGNLVQFDYTNGIVTRVIVPPPGASKPASCYGAILTADNIFIIGSSSNGSLIGVNYDDGSLAFEKNVKSYGAGVSIRNLIDLGNGYIGFGEWSSQDWYVANINILEIQYNSPEIPEGWLLEKSYLPSNVNSETWTRRLQDNELSITDMSLFALKYIP